MKQLIDQDSIYAHRQRAMSPNHPVLRGSSQNPDVFFQARETVNSYYQSFPNILQGVMDTFASVTGRQYHPFDYSGAEDADRIIVLMGSGCETAEETVTELVQQGEKVGLVKVRLYRPFDSLRLLDCIPETVRFVAVLDRTKEPGAEGEPLYKDVVTAFAQCATQEIKPFPKIIGGRYGLSSKEFTPGMVKAVFDELTKPKCKSIFTIGIHDDVTHLSIDWDSRYRLPPKKDLYQSVFYGLGSDGTVSANKNSIKIIGETTDKFAQGYFVYDSKKSGAVTVSHLRFGLEKIQSTYLIEDGQADFVACHQDIFLDHYPMLDKAKQGAMFLLNTAQNVDTVWYSLPKEVQHVIRVKQIQFYVINAYQIAEQNGLGKRINTIMQACFFKLSNVLPHEQALKEIKLAVEKTYGKSKRIIETNIKAIDSAIAHLHPVVMPDVDDAGAYREKVECQTANAPENDVPSLKLASDSSFIKNVTAEIIAGRGDLIPVSQLPVDGTFPLGTAALEKRDLAIEIPVWEPDLCTHCGKCVFVCPHSVIRSKAVPVDQLSAAPKSFKHIQIKGKDYPDDLHISYQVSPLDCTGCSLCVDICPISDKKQANRKAINMAPKDPVTLQEQDNWQFFSSLPEYRRADVKENTMKGAMLFDPLFEFSGACVGCGETSYIRLASQLFGDRMMVANATGCSSIYGGNLPTTPWATNSEGRGPAWNNSLFEDNAEFGLGMRIAIDKQRIYAQELLGKLSPELKDDELVSALMDGLADCGGSDGKNHEAAIHDQRLRIASLKQGLKPLMKQEGDHSKLAHELMSVADALSEQSVWIVGGDGWAYDIGFGGLDHVLASGKNVNILVLDSEVYSNTGGQTSKATPKAAVAKFSAAGKPGKKKDLAKIAMDYGHEYVAQVAYGAKDLHTLHAFIEAESYPGTSIIIAYSPCIAHGVDLSLNHQQQDNAVKSGHWTLLRYDPRRKDKGENPLKLDCKPPSIPYKDFACAESRFSMLSHTHPERAEQLLDESQQDVIERYQTYKTMAEGKPQVVEPSSKGESPSNPPGGQTNG